MFYLVLSILANASLVLLFRLYNKYHLNLFQVIVINYITAGSLGFLITSNPSPIEETIHSSWLPYAMALGMLFIGIFYLIGISSQKVGVAATSVANKMSLAIPVLAAVFIHHDHLGMFKIIGILLAMIAVYLSVAKEKNDASSTGQSLIYLPVLIFIGSGIIDAMINFSQKKFSLGNESELFVSAGFATSACLGMCILLVGIIIGKVQFEMKSIWAGVILGLINYCSIFFLVLCLKNASLESAAIFPINNMGVVVVSASAAYLFFGEKLSVKNRIGILLSLLAIALVAFA